MKAMKRLGFYYVYLLLIWGGFRYWVRLPEAIEELWFKPLIWLVPLFWWRLSLKGRPRLFNSKWLISGGGGVLMGVLYFGLIRVLMSSFAQSYGEVNLNMVGVALVTAIVEELTFSGFVLGLMDRFNKNKLINLVVVGLMVVGVHLPINIFVYGVGGKELLGIVLWLFWVLEI